MDKEHNVYGEACVEPNERLVNFRRTLMKQGPYVMDAARRKIVLRAIQDLVEFRKWFLWAAHVRTNHVHVVVGLGDESKTPERMMTEMKARATRLLHEAELDANEREHWTRHGSTRYLRTEETLNRAIYYTLFEQGEQMEVYEAPMLQSRARQ